MTNLTLATDYLKRSKSRLKALDVLHQDESYADVIRESQELVELLLKALLRKMGIEPPHWHDVGSLLVENQERLPDTFKIHLGRVTELSLKLRKERELAYYGDEDYIPSEHYSIEDSKHYISECRWLLQLVEPVIQKK